MRLRRADPALVGGQLVRPDPGPEVAMGPSGSGGPKRKRLTATLTATAAANGYQQRSATAHNTRVISVTLAYATPEKRKVRAPWLV